MERSIVSAVLRLLVKRWMTRDNALVMSRAFITKLMPALMSVLTAISLAANAASAEQPPPAQWQPGLATLENSRALAQALGSQLKQKLTRAMSERGAVAAIDVCRNAAPQIAAELSRLSGARVGRTSQRWRNPLNAPQPWQAQVLADAEFEEFFRNDADGARYMRAIPLGGLCATCHGREISPQIRAALAEHYPHDLATGYTIGERRGAFVVSWPVPGPPRPPSQ